MSFAETPSSPLILIVDDAEVIRQLCEHALADYRVLQAADGREALAILERESVDLVLTDVMMPGIDGLELLRLIRERTPNQVVVVMTGFADREIILQALKANADDFITKPLNLLQLRTVIRKSLERRQLREELVELKRMDRLKSDFLGLVSHKLKTPATSVSLILQNLIAGTMDLADPECQKVLGIAQEELNYLNGLIRDLLYYSDVILRQQETQLEALAPDELAQQILLDILPEAELHGLTVAFDPPANLPPLDLDRRQITFVLRALLYNAIKFTPTGGKIQFELGVEGENLRIAVVDSGVGIAAAELPKIFEKFYQIDPEQTGQVRGFGLGLYYARQFVQNHRGSIHLSSRLGAGTAATVLIPLR